MNVVFIKDIGLHFYLLNFVRKSSLCAKINLSILYAKISPSKKIVLHKLHTFHFSYLLSTVKTTITMIIH